MSDINRTWGTTSPSTAHGLPVYGHASASAVGTVLPVNPTIPTTATDVAFERGLMAGFGRTADKAQGTSAWRPPDC